MYMFINQMLRMAIIKRKLSSHHSLCSGESAVYLKTLTISLIFSAFLADQLWPSQDAFRHRLPWHPVKGNHQDLAAIKRSNTHKTFTDYSHKSAMRMYRWPETFKKNLAIWQHCSFALNLLSFVLEERDISFHNGCTYKSQQVPIIGII